jgi:hypothetical protein
MVIEIEFPDLSYISVLGMDCVTNQPIYTTFHNGTFRCNLGSRRLLALIGDNRAFARQLLESEHTCESRPYQTMDKVRTTRLF